MSRLDARAAADARSLAIVDAHIERMSHAPSAPEFDEYAASFAHVERTDRPRPSCPLELIDASSITPEPVNWIWPGWLARGKLHILAGAPSTGKTTLALAMAATITRGGTWADGPRAARGRVVIWSGEDDPQDTLTPRLIAAGADLTRVHIVGNVNDENGPRAFDPGHDVSLLAEAVAALPEPPALLIVDPIVSAVTGDSHKNAETRRALAPLVELAQRMGAALVGITHFTKGTAGREPLERVTGSLAFGALARLVLATVRRPDDHPDGPARLLVRAKSNIGPDGGGFHYQIEETELTERAGLFATHATWGDPIEGTARSLMAAAEIDHDDSERTATDEATEFLRDALADGPAKAADAQREARAAGISDKSLRRARERLGIRPRREGFGKAGIWYWELPLMPIDAIDAQQNCEGNKGINGGSRASMRDAERWEDL